MIKNDLCANKTKTYTSIQLVNDRAKQMIKQIGSAVKNE